jgi:replicative DNA helicase
MTEDKTPYTRRPRNLSQGQEINSGHGKLPPQAIDLEEAILGALMLEKNAIHEVVNILSQDAFYKEAHNTIYEAIINLYDNSRPIDILTVSNQLRNTGKLELAGGPFYITQLTSRVASSANILHHVGIVQQKYLARKIIQFSSELIGPAFSDDTDVFDLLDSADKQLSLISEISVRGGTMLHISDATQKAIKGLQGREKAYKEGRATGITTGIKEFDKLTGGWQKTFLNIIAARPGMGKTALMLHFVKSAAYSGAHACIYTLEMSDESLANRMLLSMCNVDLHNFKKGSMNSFDWEEINKAQSELNKLPIYIDPNPTVSMRYIKSNSRLMKRKGKCDVIFIDYLQLVDTSSHDGNKNRNREQEVAQASRQCKIIAKELDVPVVLLAQLSRKVEDRKSKIPELSDLRESGAIEQDADIVTFIYRAEYYGDDTFPDGTSTSGRGGLIIAKHRDGETNNVEFNYNTSMTKIKNPDDMPSTETTITNYSYPEDSLTPNSDFNDTNPF